MEYEEMAEAYSTSEELHAGMSVSWSWCYGHRPSHHHNHQLVFNILYVTCI